MAKKSLLNRLYGSVKRGVKGSVRMVRNTGSLVKNTVVGAEHLAENGVRGSVRMVKKGVKGSVRMVRNTGTFVKNTVVGAEHLAENGVRGSVRMVKKGVNGSVKMVKKTTKKLAKAAHLRGGFVRDHSLVIPGKK
jgi:hypothetical protein